MGASRSRLVVQLLTENAHAPRGKRRRSLGGYAGITLTDQIQFPTDIIAPPVMRLDLRALVFTLGVALASVFLFGPGPALATTRIDLSNSFRATGRRRPADGHSAGAASSLRCRSRFARRLDGRCDRVADVCDGVRRRPWVSNYADA
jgi:hypothetical protein